MNSVPQTCNRDIEQDCRAGTSFAHSMSQMTVLRSSLRAMFRQSSNFLSQPHTLLRGWRSFDRSCQNKCSVGQRKVASTQHTNIPHHFRPALCRHLELTHRSLSPRSFRTWLRDLNVSAEYFHFNSGRAIYYIIKTRAERATL